MKMGQMQHSSSQQLKTQMQHSSSQQWVRCSTTSSMVSKIKNPIWKKEFKNPISNPRFQKLKSKKGFDLPATAKERSMHDQNSSSIPTIKTQEHARSKPKSMHKSKPIVGFAIAEQRSNGVFLPRLGSATVVSSEWE